jgi:hypothetical protein
MDYREVIDKINNAVSDIEALEAWSFICEMYEKNPEKEEALIKVHEACGDKILNIANRMERTEKGEV